jgi:hypothetical protein
MLYALCSIRSGTTFVHRLLSLDPASRGPRLWELVRPVPGVTAAATPAQMRKDRQEREEFVRKQVDVRLAMGVRTMEQFHEVQCMYITDVF